MKELEYLIRNKDTVVANIANVYANELLKTGDIGHVETGDIALEENIDYESGQIVYSLLGFMGNKINNPDIRIVLNEKLLKSIKKNSLMYDKYILKGKDLEEDVRKALIVIRLIGIANKYNVDGNTDLN